MSNEFGRRDFLKLGSAVGAGLAIGSITSVGGCAEQMSFVGGKGNPFVASKPLKSVKVGFVGPGSQGTGHVSNLLKIKGVELKAVCDIIPERVERVQKMTKEAGQPEPKGYTGEFDYIKMCEEEDLDLVYTATPWRLHVPVCVTAMKNGKHAATEVPAAVTLDECWELVETSEKTRRHCVMMENCCYDKTEMMILNMVRKGLLGELLHAECGYLHDLRYLKLTDGVYQGNWRLQHSIKRNGDLYPTHGLGPVAQCMNVNRGNQFAYLCSMATKSRGLNLWAAEHLGADSPLATQKYALGDVVTTLIKTVNGETIVITHDTNSPRPYSRDILVQGTKGIVQKYPKELIHIEGKSKGHGWEDLSAYADEYQHPLWGAKGKEAMGAGHGGMDYIEDYRLIHCLLNGLPTDMDVYDAAAWSAVSGLSEKSIAKNGSSVKFPDFTRGLWKSREPLGIVEG